jgi:hypothetical protein
LGEADGQETPVIAITTSGGIGRGIKPLIAVMETTDLRDFNNPSSA